MLKMIAIISITLVLLIIATLFVLGFMSKSDEANGLIKGRLSQCPDKPNCVCSEFKADTDHFIEPLVISSKDAADFMTRLKSVIQEMGGTIRQEKDDYLAATFTSAIFRFVDDLEIRVDREANLVHLRSASRVGYGDRGVNRHRIEQLKRSFQQF